MSEIQLLLLLFIVIVIVSFGTILLVTSRTPPPKPLPSDQMDTGSQPELVLGTFTSALAGSSGESLRQTELMSELRQAGFYRPTAVIEYAAIRTLLVMFPVIISFVLAALADESKVLPTLLGGVVGAMLGYSLPRLYLNAQARSRRRKIEKGLPVAVDLLSLGLMSGQNMLAALRRVSQEIYMSFPELGSELEIVREQAQLNTLPHALEQWADRVQIPEVRNLVVVLTQTQKQGSDVASALFEFSNNFRINLRQRADAQASKAGFWMIFPSVFCLWIPAVIVLVGPLFFEFFHRRSEAREAIQKSREVKTQLDGVKNRLQNQLRSPIPAQEQGQP